MARRDTILVSRTLYQIGVVSLIAAVMWVAVGIYSVTGQEFKTEIDKGVLEPVNPTLDQTIIQEMAGRAKVEQDSSTTQPALEEVIQEAAPEGVEIELIETPVSTTSTQDSEIINEGAET